MGKHGHQLFCATLPLVILGCFSVPESVAQDSFYVVPIQAPPVLIAKKWIPPESEVLYLADSGIAVVENIIIKAKAPSGAARPEAEVRKTLDLLLKTNALWQPSMAAAAEVCRQLEMLGECQVHPHVLLLGEGKNALEFEKERVKGNIFGGFNPMMYPKSFHGAVFEWYDMKLGVIEYADLSSSKVVEVGILQIDASGGMLLVQAPMKLIDPETGRVLSRGRKGKFKKIDAPTSLLLDSGATLKEQFAVQLRRTVTGGLNQLKLLPK